MTVLSEPYDALEAEALRHYPDWLTLAQVYNTPAAPCSAWHPVGPEHDEPAPLAWLPVRALRGEMK